LFRKNSKGVLKRMILEINQGNDEISIILFAILILSLSGCSKTNRFSIETEYYHENNIFTNQYEDILKENGHSLSTEVAIENFIIQLKISPDGYYIDGFNYFINTGNTNQEYEYTGYFCEDNDNKNRLSCYTRKDDIYNKKYYIEQLGFSTILDTINKNEIMDVLNDLDEVYSVFLNQEVRILISVKHFENETLDFGTFKGVYYEDGVMKAEGEVSLTGYYLQYTYYLPSVQNSHHHAYMKMK